MIRDLRLIDVIYACKIYAAITGFDVATDDLRKETDGCVDLVHLKHRQALLRWLNGWGCRHIAKALHPSADDVLFKWWKSQSSNLPPIAMSLAELTPEQIDAAAGAYDDLQNRIIGRRSNNQHSVLHFGPTAAAKALFTIRPNACPPWDMPMRKSFDKVGGSRAAYSGYLRDCQHLAQGLLKEANARDIAAVDIPRKVGRPDSSLAKIIDECFWVYVTKKSPPLTEDDITQLYSWLKPCPANS